MIEKLTMEQKVKTIEEKISLLEKTFQGNPLNFFHEKEIHSLFYAICNNLFWEAKPIDNDRNINLFRQEYNTLWRYKRKDDTHDSFTKRYEKEGKAGSLDFVVLNQDFVEKNKLLTVINKDEKKRRKIRDSENNPAVDIGIEFKMAHITNTQAIKVGVINAFDKEILIDSRKLALETIPYSFIVGVSHRGDMDRERATEILENGIKEFKKYNKKNEIKIIIITPEFSIKKY